MSTKGGDTSMKEKRGRSPSLPRKIETGQHEKRGRSLSLPRKPDGKRARSPSLPRKVEIGKQRKTPNNPPSTQERKKALESRKIPTIPRPSTPLSSIPNPKKQPLDRPTPPFKVMSTKSKYNPKTSSVTTSGSMKPKGSGPPLKLKNHVKVKETNISGKKQTRKMINSSGSEKNPIILLNALSSSQHDHNVIREDEGVLLLEDCDKQHLDDENNDLLNGKAEFENYGEIHVCEPIGLDGDEDMLESDIDSYDNVSVDNKDSYDHDDNIDQGDETFSITSDDHLHYPIIYYENQESTNAHEPEHEETKPDELQPKEPEQEEPIANKADAKEDGVEIPKGEDTKSSKVAVKTQGVVVHGKKEPATAYNDVIEETVSKLRMQRKNRVLALVGAFETVILLESDVPQVS